MSQAVLWSGHHLVHLHENSTGWEIVAQSTRSCATQICFGAISEEEAAAYVASGEPLEVAGSFTIDGLGGAFIDEIHGDHHNVIGISIPLVRTMMADLGLKWTDLWEHSRSQASN